MRPIMRQPGGTRSDVPFGPGRCHDESVTNVGTRSCPDCGHRMEPGQLIGRVFLRWVGAERGPLGTQKGPIVAKGGLRNPKVHGHRCESCRLMLVSY